MGSLTLSGDLSLKDKGINLIVEADSEINSSNKTMRTLTLNSGSKAINMINDNVTLTIGEKATVVGSIALGNSSSISGNWDKTKLTIK